MRVSIYCHKPSGRTKYITKALYDGFVKHGVKVNINRTCTVTSDIAIAYGWIHEKVFRAYREAGKSFIYFDLGYWGRRPVGNAREGYHRIAINSWDTLNCMKTDCDSDRFNRLKINVKEQKYTNRSGPVLITGMSQKAAWTHGLLNNPWEKTAMDLLRKETNRTITLRHKPISKNVYQEPIENVLLRSCFLVTHHSNTAVDALVNGVPYYCVKGVAKPLSQEAITHEIIEQPRCVNDSERMQLLYDIAYCQWTPKEMRTGEMWEYVKQCV